jgi:hypothetical protein
MAKSVRSSTRKRNSAQLRSTVFGPAADARTARLSAKLQELSAQPREASNPSKETSGNNHPLHGFGIRLIFSSR